MLPRDPLAIPPVARAAAALAVAPLGEPGQQAFQRALAGQLGKSMQGQVLARLTDGSFVVRVAGTPARMQLPALAQVGAELPLTLVALAPRPTFQVGAGAAAAFAEASALPEGAEAGAAPAPRMPLARAAALLAGAPLTPSAGLPGLSGADASLASLSAAGKAIGSVLAEAMKADRPAGAIVGRAPLAAAPGADPRQMAAALQQAIGHSGLFYESHLAEWVQGRRTLAELGAEPQMLAARAGGAPAAEPSAAQLASLQLAAREQAQVSWQGQAWPGQPLHLELGRAPRGDGGAQGDGDGQADGGDGDAWQSRLRLRFALLGEVAASVTLAGGGLHLRLEAGSEAAGELLRAHAPRLSGALDAAGVALSSLAIHAGHSDD